MPADVNEWQRVADGFNERWNFPNCVGAMDGKHVTIKPPSNSGSFFYNYKHTFSIVLLALVDYDYKFLYVDIGSNGRVSDGGVFRNSTLSSLLSENKLQVPAPKPLPGGTFSVPHLIVADDAFPLKVNIMKPYSHRGLTVEERIFNYRLSRARRIVENAFGILANRFRVFLKPIALAPEIVEIIVMAACSLHNFLRDKSESRNVYMPAGIDECESEERSIHSIQHAQWREQQILEGLGTWNDLTQQGGNNPTNEAKAVRDELRRYFMSPEGEVSWQHNMV